MRRARGAPLPPSPTRGKGRVWVMRGATCSALAGMRRQDGPRPASHKTKCSARGTRPVARRGGAPASGLVPLLADPNTAVPQRSRATGPPPPSNAASIRRRRRRVGRARENCRSDGHGGGAEENDEAALQNISRRCKCGQLGFASSVSTASWHASLANTPTTATTSRTLVASNPAALARCRHTARRCSSRGSSALHLLPDSDVQPSSQSGKRVYSRTAKYSASTAVVGDRWRVRGSFAGRRYAEPPYTRNAGEGGASTHVGSHTTEKRASHCTPPAAESEGGCREPTTGVTPQKRYSHSSICDSTNDSYCLPVGDMNDTTSAAS